MGFLKRCRRGGKHFCRALSVRGVILVPLFIILFIIIICCTVFGIKKLVIFIRVYQHCPQYLCPSDKPHISCHHPMDWSEECDNPKEIKFTGEMKYVVVEKINYYRNIISGNLWALPYIWIQDGKPDSIGRPKHDSTINQEPCARCGLIQWDNDLEYLAQLALKFCDSPTQENYCYNTKKFVDPGQLRSSQHARPYKEWLQFVLDRWARARKSAEQYMLIHEKQTHVGCAMILTGEITRRKINLICFFAYKNTSFGHDHWYVGRGGSKCSTGVDYRYPHLCSSSEVIYLDDERPSQVKLRDHEKPFGFIHFDASPHQYNVHYITRQGRYINMEYNYNR